MEKVMLYDIINQLCQDKGTTVAALERYMGIGNGVIRHWNTAYPRVNILAKIADYFGVSLDWLVGTHFQAIKIPILGSVVAGVPIEAITDILGWEEIPADWGGIKDYFALRIDGSSMAPVLVEGDTIICHKQSMVESGEIAIVMVEQEKATVKKVKFLDNGIMLIGFNEAVYPPTFYTAKEIMALPVQILGKVIEVRRRF